MVQLSAFPLNQILEGDKIFLEYTNNNTQAFDRLMKRWVGILKSIDYGECFKGRRSLIRNNQLNLLDSFNLTSNQLKP